MITEPSILEEALWPIVTVEARTGLEASTIYRMEADGTFPARRKISERRVAWLASEVVRWMRDRPREKCAPLARERAA